MLNSAVYKWNTAIVGRVKQVRVHVWTVCRDKKEAVVERWQFVEVRLYYQCAKKVVSDSLGLVDFAIGLVNFVLNFPDG